MVELETAKLNIENFLPYSYNYYQLKSMLIDSPEEITPNSDTPELKGFRVYMFIGKIGDELRQEIIEIIETIEKETQENKAYRSKAMKNALLKLTRSSSPNQEQ